MKVVCIRPFGAAKPGDVAEVPDDAAVDPWHWLPVTEDEAEPEPDEAPETPPETPSPVSPEVLPLTIPTEM